MQMDQEAVLCALKVKKRRVLDNHKHSHLEQYYVLPRRPLLATNIKQTYVEYFHNDKKYNHNKYFFL